MKHLLSRVIINHPDYPNDHHRYALADLHIEHGYVSALSYESIDIDQIQKGQFYVTPGFVNAHLHPNQLFDRRKMDNLSITQLLSRMHVNRPKTDEDRYVQSMCVLMEAIQSGSTSVYALASHPMPVIHAFSDLKLSGAVTCIFNDIWEGVGHAPQKTDFDHIEKKFQSYFAHQTDTFKVHIGAASNLAASNELLQFFNLIAKKYDTKVNLHTAEGQENIHLCKKLRGTTPVRLLDRLGCLNDRWNLIHVTNIDDEEAHLIAKRGAKIIHCPISNAKTGVGIAPLRALHEAGVVIGIGSDACSNNNTNNPVNEACFAIFLQNALHQKADLFSHHEAANWLFQNGLDILGFSNDQKFTHPFTVGAHANFLLWDLGHSAFSPLYYGDFMSTIIYQAADIKPHTVFVHGKKWVDSYQFCKETATYFIDKANTWARQHGDF